MTDTEIRESLREVAAATEAPLVDALAFQRLVRAERRRHRTGRVALVGASAAGLALVGTAAWQAVDTRSEPEPPGGSVATSPEIRTTGWAGGPVFFLQKGRLTALDPRGEVHDLGIRSEEVIGFTAEGVWAVDEESHVVWFRAETNDEGPVFHWSFTRAPGPPGVDTAPVAGPVLRAELSGDGRYLAWLDLDDKVTTYDLKADAVSSELQTDPQTQLVDVGAAGVLLSENGNLVLRSGSKTIDLPDTADLADLASSLERSTVAVAGNDGITHVYDVSSGDSAVEIGTVRGSGDVSPDGLAAATIRRSSHDGVVTSLWKQSGTVSLSGLVGAPESLAWADERMLLVVTGEQRDSALYACDVETADCSPMYGGTDLRLPTRGS